jgi:hypothetical protein
MLGRRLPRAAASSKAMEGNKVRGAAKLFHRKAGELLDDMAKRGERHKQGTLG